MADFRIRPLPFEERTHEALLSLFRGFNLNERLKLEFRAEAFNLTNTPHFSAPAANVSGGNFLVITSATGATGAGDER